MGRASAMSIAAAATAALGSYKAFVPAVAGSSSSSDAVQVQSLRGAAPEAAAPATSTVLVAGMAGVAATALSSATRRRATATMEAEEAPAPPQFDPSKQLGATAPLGFFDPLNFAKVGDEDGFRKLRIAELKHGRVAMMASVGAVIQHYTQWGGFEKVPKGIFAITDGTGLIGFVALVMFSGAMEMFVWKEKENAPISNIGDYGNPFQLGLGRPLGLSDEMKARELENGRAAMIATSGIIVAELLTGLDGMQQLGFS
mmetsp:Transcript_93369/g.166053  ORF Transcript_93369/g.166053 Transcript_93369/m.166053 type:complete len:257 (-) Transcript_93369:47-817(-)|eukprot:CAMPEP_0197646466 /NCGR_PEP_ID=MMETSP1338-20131121/23416_1 /TAXON_ID=43686 ORGANISM="Pelagodinium beii, Strain RCC1491" /NCGR_SAMPLE_ID=MMETSP1338 /ASSEMBLY_ACC=CAM_ASM_000754 /LENGTH=256 /DNA_ID=CAMNT_0043220103 /DNA_START=49 /DNA_END=819 /DNA_ORIENTATION=-